MQHESPPTLDRIAGDASARVLGGAFLAVLAAAAVCDHVTGRVMSWLGTNVLLAAIAPIAAAFLFAARRRRAGWWVAAAATLVVLPNTPYVLTDVIHFNSDRRAAAAFGLRAFDVPIAYLVVLAVGVFGYAYVLARLIADVRPRGVWATRITVMAVNAVCAAGVWLGRVPRLNSWDIARPHDVTAALSKAFSLRAVGDMGVVFIGAGAAALALWWMVAAATHRALPQR